MNMMESLLKALDGGTFIDTLEDIQARIERYESQEQRVLVQREQGWTGEQMDFYEAFIWAIQEPLIDLLMGIGQDFVEYHTETHSLSAPTATKAAELAFKALVAGEYAEMGFEDDD